MIMCMSLPPAAKSYHLYCGSLACTCLLSHACRHTQSELQGVDHESICAVQVDELNARAEGLEAELGSMTQERNELTAKLKLAEAEQKELRHSLGSAEVGVAHAMIIPLYNKTCLSVNG